MPTYKLTISYDGTAYHGWQIQPNGTTIQEVIQNAIQAILQKPIPLIGSGRTDAGVHALGQIAHFSCVDFLNLHQFKHGLNCLLPADIRIIDIVETLNNFHAQHSAIGKIYHYHIHLDAILSPFIRFYRWHVREKIQLHLLEQAAKLFIGTHDFTSFANEAHKGSVSKNPIRTLKRLDVVAQEGGIRLEFEADGFLYKMVRNIVSFMMSVARQKRSLEEIPLVFKAKDRRMAAMVAPPQGLFLIKVHYPICFQSLKSG